MSPGDIEATDRGRTLLGTVAQVLSGSGARLACSRGWDIGAAAIEAQPSPAAPPAAPGLTRISHGAPSRGVNPAHTRDPEELPRAILHVHRLHMEATGPSRDKDGRLALRPGAAAVIFGNGVVHHVGAPGAAPDGSKGEPRGMRTTVPNPRDGGPDLGKARPARVPLSCGFRTKHLVPTNYAGVVPRLAAFHHNIIPFTANRMQASLLSATFAVDGEALDDGDPRRLLDSIVPDVWALEDTHCTEQLGSLLWHDMPLENCASAGAIAKFAMELTAGSGKPPQFDTAFVSPRLMGSLMRRSGSQDYENATQDHGVSIISGEGVPEGTMYVTSSLRGPVFVNGPTVLRREEGALVVSRYCATRAPPGGEPGENPGFAVAVGR